MDLVCQHECNEKAQKRNSVNASQATMEQPSRTIVHAKLEMTNPDSQEELEADAAANDIVQGGKIARSILAGSSDGGMAVSSQMECRLNSLQGCGQVMPDGLRNMMERGFNRDFSQVRLHTDSEAASLSSSIHAKAFTHGNDIYFNQGQFSPNTSEGQRLMAHELTHTIQNSGVIARESNEEDARVAKEEKLRSDLSDILKDKGFQSKSITIVKNQLGGEAIIDEILSDCEKIIEEIDPEKKDHKKMIVQQVYNTLTEISSAMDILVNEKLINPDKEKNDNMTAWIKVRDNFVDVVRKLATKAHNPAIASLIYEGTYYPSSYSLPLHNATDFAVKQSHTSYLSKYGAVCNNAAYGALTASGATNSNSQKSRISSLKKSYRHEWSEYDLKGSGWGNHALDSAKQGDVVIFWDLSKDSVLVDFDEWLSDKNFEKKGDLGKQLKEDDRGFLDDLIKRKNYDASHIEVIVGVQGSGNSKKFLLSGAHDEDFVNGIARTSEGNLNWKSAREVRGHNRMMRLFPINRDNDFIEVDLSNMQYKPQTYKNVAEGEYTNTGYGNIDRFVYENSLGEVTINWLSKTLSKKSDVDQ